MSFLAAELAALLSAVRRPGDFFAAGTAELLALSLEIEDVGPVALPLLPEQAERIVGAAEAAPYGRGEETVIDPAVRRCWQPEKLVCLLDHAYTPAELGFAALKGGDAAATAAARQAQCDLRLALLTVEESGAAEYADSYGSGRWDQEDAFEVGEVYARSVALSELRRADGTEAVLGAIPVEEEELSPPDACDDLTPDEEHFQEATGNEGASFERTYRRAALVLWPSERLFVVLSQAGLPVTLPYLDDLARRWAASGADQRSPLWRDAHELAGHMTAQWPQQGWPLRPKTPSDAARLLGSLTRLDDTAAIERFLTEIVARDGFETGDSDAIIEALDRLAPARHAPLVESVIAGTAAGSFAACANLLARVGAEWPECTSDLSDAAAQLVNALPGDPARAMQRPAWHDAAKVDASFVADLLTGLCAVSEPLAERAVDHLLAWPGTYRLDAVLVPATRTLLAMDASRYAAVGRLRTACRVHLRARIAEPLTPPADWARPAAVGCHCARCGELARFLADPERKSWALKAVQADRSHVEGTIKQARCDVDVATERRGSPHSLVCTKNQASYERRAKQRAEDVENLARLAD